MTVPPVSPEALAEKMRERATMHSSWGSTGASCYLLIDGADAITALLARVEQAEVTEAKLRAATDMLVAAEKIVPGVIQTSGRFALGDVAEARARAERAETALREIAKGQPHYIDGEGVYPSTVARAALAASGEAALPEPDDVGTGRDSVGTYASRTKPETVPGSGSAASEEGT